MILGFDPGLAKVGWAVQENRKYIDGGLITTSSDLPLSKRLKRLASEVRAVIKEYPDAEIYVEHPGYNGSLHGSHYCWMGITCIATVAAPRDITLITASQARKDLVGEGYADKETVRARLRKRFGAQIDGLNNDTTDALCIALCKRPKDVALHGKRKNIKN